MHLAQARLGNEADPLSDRRHRQNTACSTIKHRHNRRNQQVLATVLLPEKPRKAPISISAALPLGRSQGGALSAVAASTQALRAWTTTSYSIRATRCMARSRSGRPCSNPRQQHHIGAPPPPIPTAIGSRRPRRREPHRTPRPHLRLTSATETSTRGGKMKLHRCPRRTGFARRTPSGGGNEERTKGEESTGGGARAPVTLARGASREWVGWGSGLYVPSPPSNQYEVLTPRRDITQSLAIPASFTQGQSHDGVPNNR